MFFFFRQLKNSEVNGQPLESAVVHDTYFCILILYLDV